MRGLIFALFLLAGLLVCGCVGAPPAEETAEAGEEVPEGEVGAPAGEEEVEAPEEAAPSQPSEPVDYSGMEYANVLASGNPVICDITSTYQGETMTMRVYMKGENRIRYEYEFAGENMVMIMRDDVTYFTNMIAEDYPQCAWLSVEAEEPEPAEPGEPGDYQYTYEPPDFEDMPETTIECSPWTYDESMFTPPTTNVCTMEEWTELLTGGYDIPDYQ